MQLLLVITAFCTGLIDTTPKPTFKLIPAPKVVFNSFVDCNMAEVWVEDTFRIFPGKYGEDSLRQMGEFLC